MANANPFLNPYEILAKAPENKYLRTFSLKIQLLYRRSKIIPEIIATCLEKIRLGSSCESSARHTLWVHVLLITCQALSSVNMT